MKECDIKGSPSKIKYQYGFLAILFIKTVGNGCSRGFIDDTFNGESGNGSRILGCLSLCIIEVSRYSDNGPFDLCSQEAFGRFFHLTKYHAGYFLWRKVFERGVFARLDFDSGFIGLICNQLKGKESFVLLNTSILELSANQPFHIKNGIGRVLGCLILCRISHQSCSIGKKCHVGWCDTIALFICAYFHTIIAPYSHTGIGGSKINSNARPICR
mmetsp:Transcript_21266/g.29820  ORF Transcript_21266/g.29820 Transcript_21266/m.29820 type:complete len:215 (+) Transcript_21266:1462-2106(+)